MKNRNYLVDRDNVFAGQVINAKNLYQSYDHTKVYPMNFNILRSTLFTLNKDNLADDLLYSSDNYPVLNVTDNKELFSYMRETSDARLLIANAINISELLKHYGYSEKLTYDEVLKIRKEIFSYIFLNIHVFDFGYVMKNNYYPVLKESPLFNYFDTVYNLRDGIEDNKDAFKPSKLEGPVRSLKKLN